MNGENMNRENMNKNKQLDRADENKSIKPDQEIKK